jgi:hypothetical protein
MTQRDNKRQVPLNGHTETLEEKQQQLVGQPAQADQSAAFDQSLVEHDRVATDSDRLYSDVEAGQVDPDEDESESLDLMLDEELRAEETDNPLAAAEEGYTYVPPIDPPVVPSELDNAEVASGFGTSALDEPYDDSHRASSLPGSDDMSAMVREALRAVSSTTAYADTIEIITRGATVILRGVVDDLVDSDNLAAVAEYVAGVDEVIDELRVRSLET